MDQIDDQPEVTERPALKLEPRRFTTPVFTSSVPVIFYVRDANGYWYELKGKRWVRCNPPIL